MTSVRHTHTQDQKTPEAAKPMTVGMTDATKLAILKSLLKSNDVKTFKMILDTIDDKSSLEDVFTDACCMGKDNFVELMLECGVDVNIRDKRFGNTGLMLAASEARESTVTLLLTHGADVLAKKPNIEGTTVFMMCRSATIYKILKAAANVQEASKAAQEAAKATEDAANCAVREDDIAASSSITDDSTNTLVESSSPIESVPKASIDIAQCITKNVTKLAVLDEFLEFEDIHGFETILKSNVDKSTLGNHFTSACARGKDDFVKMMLDFGVDVNIRDKANGSTGLMLAAQQTHESTVTLLLAHGADPLLVSTGTLSCTARWYCISTTIMNILKNAEDAQKAAKITDEAARVRAELRAEILAEIRAEVRAEIRAEVRDEIRDEVRAEHKLAIDRIRMEIQTLGM